MSTPTASRLLLISADCHAGATHEMYRAHLESTYHEQFDQWRAKYRNPFRDLTTDTRNRNWDDDRRNSELESDGVAGEVVFPNTIPPFFPTGAVIARPPKPEEYELRLAGIRAHNRWLAAWCARHPQRRAGIGQIFINDIDDAIADARWCHANGLRGGILLQPVPDDMKHIEPLYSEKLDPLWAVCEELGVVCNLHSGGAAMPDYGRHQASGMLWIAEATFFGRRPLVQLLLSGVFARFPRLRVAMTETGASWIPETLKMLDTFWTQAKRDGRIGELKYQPDQLPPLPPSEYFARNVWVGSSFPSPGEARARHDIGLNHYMWGSDYPHDESSFPNTREALRRAFAGTPEAELRAVLGGNAAELYNFDVAALQRVADQIGPTLEELREPYEGIPDGNRSPAFTRA
jgi:predicted TIM-barrel fold metal-dependent hydrolase